MHAGISSEVQQVCNDVSVRRGERRSLRRHEPLRRRITREELHTKQDLAKPPTTWKILRKTLAMTTENQASSLHQPCTTIAAAYVRGGRNGGFIYYYSPVTTVPFKSYKGSSNEGSPSLNLSRVLGLHSGLCKKLNRGGRSARSASDPSNDHKAGQEVPSRASACYCRDQSLRRLMLQLKEQSIRSD